MNSSVCVVILFFLCLDNGAGLICNPFSSPKPEPPIHEHKPSTEKPVFHPSEGTEITIDCESTELYHQWYQAYQNSRSRQREAIGTIPLQRRATKTHYIITVERFDNNTIIFCKNETIKKQKYFNTSIELDDIPQNIEEPITKLPYSERKATFSCEEYIAETNDTYVGVINTTSNLIKTYRTISAHPKFDITYNGTILCCVYYTVTEKLDEKWITRHIAKKTLLIYDDSVLPDRLERNGEILNEELSTSLAGNQITMIFISVAIAGVIILLVIFITCKKRCRKKPISDSKVLYVDLDILRNDRPESISRPCPEQESPYAQIVGVLKPDQ